MSVTRLGFLKRSAGVALVAAFPALATRKSVAAPGVTSLTAPIKINPEARSLLVGLTAWGGPRPSKLRVYRGDVLAAQWPVPANGGLTFPCPGWDYTRIELEGPAIYQAHYASFVERT